LENRAKLLPHRQIKPHQTKAQLQKHQFQQHRRQLQKQRNRLNPQLPARLLAQSQAQLPRQSQLLQQLLR
jgi:hypothetical protein